MPCDHHHHPSPGLFHHPRLKLPVNKTMTPCIAMWFYKMFLFIVLESFIPGTLHRHSIYVNVNCFCSLSRMGASLPLLHSASRLVVGLRGDCVPKQECPKQLAGPGATLRNICPSMDEMSPPPLQTPKSPLFPPSAHHHLLPVCPHSHSPKTVSC